MTTRVLVNGEVSAPFDITVGVKQGCVLDLTVYNLYLVAISLLSKNSLDVDDGVRILYNLDCSVFNLR